jgi:hypothetical protein
MDKNKFKIIFMKLTIYILIAFFVTFISFCYYTIPGKFLPNKSDRILILISGFDPNLAYVTQINTLSEQYEYARNSLTNINTQINNLQNIINASEEKLKLNRQTYLFKENDLLSYIKNIIKNIKSRTYSQSIASQNLKDYTSINEYNDANRLDIKDYYSTIHNSLVLIINYLHTVNNNYILINALTAYINNIIFGKFCIEEIAGLTDSTNCRNYPTILLNICQTNDINSLNAIYAPLPILSNVVGNNALINLIHTQDDKILNITPLSI